MSSRSDDRIQHHVDVTGLDREVDGGVVDQLVGAQVPQEIVLVLSGGANHVRATRLGDLHREVDAPGCRMDQHALTGMYAGNVHERLPSGKRR
jgi:hypothetical protein